MFNRIDSKLHNILVKSKIRGYFVLNKHNYNFVMYNECHTKTIPLFDCNFGGDGDNGDKGPNILWTIIAATVTYILSKKHEYYKSNKEDTNQYQNQNKNEKNEKNN